MQHREPVIDAHHHLWDLQNNKYPWLQERPLKPRLEGNIEPIAKDYLLKDYLDDIRNQNVVKSVHVQTGWDPADPVGETRWLQGVADQHGYPHGIVARATLDAPDVEQVLEGHLRYKNVRGIRHMINWHPDPVKTYADRPDLVKTTAWRRGFALLHRFDLSFDLQLYPAQMADAAALAHANQETLIILNHAGMPVDRDEEGIRLWKRGIRQLASAPNVVVKISGLGTVDWKWTVESIRPFVLQTIEAFGISRCMFASNFPVDKLFSDFDTLYGSFQEITASFSVAERRKLFHDNAARYYRL
ncbi:MAG: amidohydrolase [Verrucomicrobia bacterium]|nr:amidohydrolase [Verrucomicrobiota bacterium]